MKDQKKRVYVETYGCQMNVADSEVVLSLLSDGEYETTNSPEGADVLLINTCSVRENAEQRVYGRLGEFKRLKSENPKVVIGVLGCMAERLRETLMSNKSNGVGQVVDVIVGPDEYRKVPELLYDAAHGRKGIATQLSRVETYDDITPLRTDGICAWISVMRGCDKFCTFCVVPFTRGRERSRSLTSIVQEIEVLSSRGFKEVTLLGQNVNSYRDGESDFADLLTAAAEVDRSIRVRFTTSHPQDMSDKLVGAISRHKNICNFVHLPVQSGSDRILELMNRTYNRAHYLGLIQKLRTAIPQVSISTDIISGFPTETEDDHKMTLDLMEEVRYDGAYTFKYSPRENTPAFKMADDVPDDLKGRRVNEILELQSAISLRQNQTLIGERREVLVEGRSKKSADEWQGRTDGNQTVIFPRANSRPGEYIDVTIVRANSATLFGEICSTSENRNEFGTAVSVGEAA